MKALTTKESGKIVPNKDIDGVCYIEDIKLVYYPQLLDELDFRRDFEGDSFTRDYSLKTFGYMHRRNNMLKALWVECGVDSCKLIIMIGKEKEQIHYFGGPIMIHDFVSQVLDKIRGLGLDVENP